MYSPKLLQSTVNAVRLAEVLQVLVRHGFAGLLRQAGFHKSLPARILHNLKLMEAPSGPIDQALADQVHGPAIGDLVVVLHHHRFLLVIFLEAIEHHGGGDGHREQGEDAADERDHRDAESPPLLGLAVDGHGDETIVCE